MSHDDRLRSLRKFRWARQTILWGGGLLGGLLMGIVAIVLPYALEPRQVAPAVDDVSPVGAMESVVTSEEKKTSAPPEVALAVTTDDEVRARAKALIDANDEERQRLALLARRQLQHELEQGVVSEPKPERPNRFPAPRDLDPPEATLEFWEELNLILAEEEQIRETPFAGLHEGNTQNFLSRRVKANEFAAEEIARLRTDKVDPQVVELSQALIDQYVKAAEIASSGEKAFQETGAKLRGSEISQHWKAAEREQKQAFAALTTKGAEVQKSLEEKYQLRFPPLKK